MVVLYRLLVKNINILQTYLLVSIFAAVLGSE
jgi:hypothetical protein